ncbi:MAG: adenylate cyclase [Chthoniobacter sp.]|jgi:adenylate cyclase|nr:adenylate cyclase [Chthoniobacter sp.]
MKPLRAALQNPGVACLLLGLGVFAFVIGARELGFLQPAELLVYDKGLRHRAGPARVDDRIVCVEITEADIRKYDFPVSDSLFAKLLEKIARAQPAAIGLDIYRDLPVPRDGSQVADLNRVLQEHQNIVGIFGFGDMEHPVKIPFAPALAATPERYGFNDFPFEFGAVRRAFLLIWDRDHNIYPSFCLTLAMQTGIDVEQVENGMRIGKAIYPRFTHDEGGFVHADDGGHQFLLDFKGPRKFVTCSLDDALSDRLNDETWRGKIVLIGEGAESAHDFESTPLQVNMPGVELHAQALNQLLRAAERGDKMTISWSERGEIAWIFAWCFVGVATGFFVRKPVLLLLASGGIAAVLAGICWFAFTRDLWLPFVPALGGNILAAAIITAYTRHLERQDRDTLMRLFSQHVSRTIAESMWEHREEFMEGTRPRPQKLQATVLFTDLRNFSTVSEKLEAAEVMEWINEYMQALAKHVEARGGFINKYMGDAIMAVFGFPIASTADAAIRQDAVHAVQCALDMGSELQRLNVNWQKLGNAPVQMRVGIFSGPAVAGCVGSCERLEFTIMGDTVNTASRLEGFDKDYATDDGCRILIGHSTFELLDGKFPTKFVQTIELKGKNEKTTIYRVLGCS